MSVLIIEMKVESLSHSYLKGTHMKKFGTIIFAIILISPQNSALADPPVPIDVPDKLQIELCYLSSEIPHLSGHVPGTMNVSGRTVCKGISGSRVLSVKVTLKREFGAKSKEITKSARGTGSVIVYVSMPCIWKKGQPSIKYEVLTFHKLSSGKTALTGKVEYLEC